MPNAGSAKPDTCTMCGAAATAAGVPAEPLVLADGAVEVPRCRTCRAPADEASTPRPGLCRYERPAMVFPADWQARREAMAARTGKPLRAAVLCEVCLLDAIASIGDEPPPDLAGAA